MFNRISVLLYILFPAPSQKNPGNVEPCYKGKCYYSPTQLFVAIVYGASVKLDPWQEPDIWLVGGFPLLLEVSSSIVDTYNLL